MTKRRYVQIAERFPRLLESRPPLHEFLDCLSGSDWEELVQDLAASSPDAQVVFPSVGGETPLVAAAVFLRDLSPNCSAVLLRAIGNEITRMIARWPRAEADQAYLGDLLFLLNQLGAQGVEHLLQILVLDSRVAVESRQRAAAILAVGPHLVPDAFWSRKEVQQDPTIAASVCMALAESDPERSLKLASGLGPMSPEGAAVEFPVRIASRKLAAMSGGYARLATLVASAPTWLAKLIESYVGPFEAHAVAKKTQLVTLRIGTSFEFTDTTIPVLLSRTMMLRDKYLIDGIDFHIEHTPWSDHVLTELRERVRDAQVYNVYQTKLYMASHAAKFQLLDVFQKVSEAEGGTFYLMGHLNDKRVSALYDEYKHLRSELPSPGEPADRSPSLTKKVKKHLDNVVAAIGRGSTIVAPQGDMKTAVDLVLNKLGVPIGAHAVKISGQYSPSMGFQEFVERPDEAFFFFGGQDQRAVAEHMDFVHRVGVVLDAAMLALAGIRLPDDLSRNCLVVEPAAVVQAKRAGIWEKIYEAFFDARRLVGGGAGDEDPIKVIASAMDTYRTDYERRLSATPIQVSQWTLQRNRQAWSGPTPRLRILETENAAVAEGDESHE